MRIGLEDHQQSCFSTDESASQRNTRIAIVSTSAQGEMRRSLVIMPVSDSPPVGGRVDQPWVLTRPRLKPSCLTLSSYCTEYGEIGIHVAESC